MEIPTYERRIHRLEDWQRDISRELRDWEEWVKVAKPFLDQLQADLIYRQRKHAETVGEWTLFSKIIAGTTATILCVSTIGTFVLQIVHHF